MRNCALTLLACVSALAIAGQPLERFRGSDRFTFSQGSADPRYGNVDSAVRVQMQVFILGHQEFTGASTTPEVKVTKVAGSLDFSLKLSDFDPLLPPDVVNLVGTDLGNDLMKHTTDSVLPGPYVFQGTYSGVTVDLTLRNVHVTGSLTSQGSNAVTAPAVNPVLNEFCDVQYDDVNAGASNTLTAIPGQVSGWIVSPLFTVQSMRMDVTGIQQAGQVPAHIVAPGTFNVQLGKVDVGNVASLATQDGDALRVCKFIVPNQQVAPITVEVGGTAPGVPLYLSLVSLSRMTQAGSFQQTLDLFDFAGSGYGSGDARTDAIGTTYVARQLDATGSVARYLGSGNELRARYRVRQTGPASSAQWCAEHDQVAWIVTP